MCHALLIVSSEKSNESSSLKVVPWGSNTLDWLWKDMNELMWIGNSADSIFIHLVEWYVMCWCRYTSVQSHCKVVPNVYIGLYRWYLLHYCCWCILCILGGVCVLYGYCMVAVLINLYTLVKSEYVSFPIGMSAFHNRWNCAGAVGLCRLVLD